MRQEAPEQRLGTHSAVLVIDDDKEIRHALRELLVGEGYDVQEASDGQQALPIMASANQRLIVLLDLMMPGMDGYEVCRRVWADLALRDRHLIVLMSARKLLNRADFPVAVANIAKPFDIERLLEMVNRLAERTG
jgi:CheY-like chemotaxis protein